MSAAGDALVRILDRARPLALVLRVGGALQAALSTRRRASTLGPNERRVTSQSSELWRRTPQRAQTGTAQSEYLHMELTPKRPNSH